MTPLEIVVTGDVSVALAGLKDVQGELGRTAISSKNAGAAFDALAKQMANFQRAAANSLNPELVNIYKGKVQALQELMRVLAGQADAEAASTSKGFDGMGSAIQRTGKLLTQGYSALRKLAYVLPGIGIAGILAFATGPILNYIESLNLFGAKTKEEKEAADQLAKATKSIFESTGKEATQVVSLIAVLKSETETRERKLAAIKELQKINPDIFSQLDLEKDKVNGLDAAYQDYIKSLKTAVAAKILQAQLDDKVTKLVKLEGVEESGVGKAIDSAMKKAAVSLAKKGDNTLLFNLNIKTSIKDKKIATLNSQIEDLQNRLSELSKGVKVGGVEIKGGRLKQIDDEIKELKDKKELYSNSLADTKNYNAQIKKLEDERNNIDPKEKKPKASNPFEIDLAALEKNYEQVQLLREKTLGANLSDASKNGIVVNDILLQDQINFLNAKELLLNKYNKNDFENFKTLEAAKKKLIEENLKFAASQIIPSTLPKPQGIAKETIEKINPKIQIFPTDNIVKGGIAIDNLDKKMKDTQKELEDDLGPAFENLFTNILEGSHKTFDSFIKDLKSMIVQLAATVLKAAALAAILSLIFPASGGGQGFTGFFKSILGVTGHATGVSNSSGGVALVGERGPELVNLPRGSDVIPNGQLNASLGGGQVFIPNLTLRGQDLIVAFNRASQTKSRIG